MKSNGSVYVSIVFALLVGYFSYQWWFNQNRVVKRRLGELAATLSVPAGESELERVGRLARLGQYLADDIKVTGGRTGQALSSRDAVMIAAAGFRPAGGGSVDFVDVDVKVDGDTARAYATAEVTTRDASAGEPALDSRETAFSVVKRGGVWVVSAVELKDPVKAEEPAPPPSRP